MRFHLSLIALYFLTFLLIFSSINSQDKQLEEVTPVNLINKAIEWGEQITGYDNLSCIGNSTVEIFEGKERKSKTEIISRLYWELPDKLSLSVISAKKEAGKKMSANIFGNVFFKNCMEKEININNRISVPTPFQKNGYTLYNFSIDGLINVDEDKFYVIKFWPKSENRPLLKGEIWISDYDYSVVRVNWVFNDPTAYYMPRIKDIRFDTQYMRYEQKFWLPYQSTIEAHFKLLFSKEQLVRRTTEYSDYVVNIERNKIKDTLYSQKESLRKIYDFERNVLRKSEKDTVIIKTQ